MFRNFYQNKRVLITGHTGFKGAWLTLWLHKLGAQITGLSLPPYTTPNLFDQLRLQNYCQHHIVDIRDLTLVQKIILETQPDLIFHLAAQPLVRESYSVPIETWHTNTLGTAHILEALRALQKNCTAILITTDKCYENREWLHAYREDDPLGGYDPYSASKAAAELVIHSYRRSFFAPPSPIRIASARAGNVIGGGDWAKDRLIPDCIRALSQSLPIPIRNPHATRPWQHVLEPLSGYLWLGVVLSGSSSLTPLSSDQLSLYSAFNFGPHVESNRPVAQVVEELLEHIPGTWSDQSDPHAPHEASRLQLAIDKAYHLLGWTPVWNFSTTIAITARWYRAYIHGGADFSALTEEDIETYTHDACKIGLPWTL